jgi:hypothetical protein
MRAIAAALLRLNTARLPRRAVGFFPTVAGKCVLRHQFVLLRGDHRPATPDSISASSE